MLKETVSTQDFNTTFVLRDAKGRIKPLWNENKLARAMRRRGVIAPRVPGVFGAWRDQMEHHNLITNAGHQAAQTRIGGASNTNFLTGVSFSAFANIAIGIGTNAAAATDQALSNEITSGGGTRAAGTLTQTTTTTTNDTMQLVKTFSFTSSFAVTEEGIFDSATAPTVTTLSASIATTGATSCTVTSGTGIANGDYLQIEGEIVQVTAGGGTTSLTITRAQGGTTAATHASGVGVVDINSSHNLLARQQFASISVLNGDSLQITHRVSC